MSPKVPFVAQALLIKVQVRGSPAGRVDDVINVSGHRIGTAEVEGALDSHPSVSEAAVVPVPHDIKGQGIYAFVSLMAVCAARSLKSTTS